jgi:hypothetical protein
MGGWWEAAILIIGVAVVLIERYRKITAVEREVDRYERTRSRQP